MKERLEVLHAMTDALMKYETIDAVQIDALMNGKVVPAPKDWHRQQIDALFLT